LVGQVTAMRLRSRRWKVTASKHADYPIAGYGLLSFPRRARQGRIRWWIRTSAVLTVMGLVRAARWWPLLTGLALTVVGIALRDAPGGVVLLPGLILLMSTLLIPPSPKAERVRRAILEHEMAAYSTPAQRRDLETTLSRYPDGDTHELRDILARQAAASCPPRTPGAGS
jgi:hypothetical protein